MKQSAARGGISGLTQVQNTLFSAKEMETHGLLKTLSEPV
jgi:hypothetical protein